MKNIIFIAHRLFPLESGDSLYNYGVVKEINKISNLYVYSYVHINDVDNIKKIDDDLKNVEFYVNKSDYSRFLNLIAKIGKVRPVDKKMMSDICQTIISKDIDIVFVSHIFTVQFALILRRKFPKLKIIYISHNAEAYNLIERDLQNTQYANASWFKQALHFIRMKIAILLYKYYEHTLLTISECYFSISKSDILIHQNMYGTVSKPYLCKPLIEFSCSKSPEKLKVFNKRLLMVGSMSWYPNIEAAVWFVHNVMTVLANEGYTLYLVGGGPNEEIYRLKELYPDNIVITGRVPSTDEYFFDCDISVIPIFSGTGVKIKVLESIGRGIPTIATSFAAKDYDISEEILIADTAEQFIKCIRNLEANYLLREKLFVAMKKYYSEYMKLSPEIIKLIKKN